MKTVNAISAPEPGTKRLSKKDNGANRVAPTDTLEFLLGRLLAEEIVRRDRARRRPQERTDLE
jgi:hypothetical protein